jgi:hypothetical protein
MPREIDEAKVGPCSRKDSPRGSVFCPLEVPSTTLQDHAFTKNDDHPHPFTRGGVERLHAVPVLHGSRRPRVGASRPRRAPSEFAGFGWAPEAIPDPQDPATFARETGLARARASPMPASSPGIGA